jgi:hypothetical protein
MSIQFDMGTLLTAAEFIKVFHEGHDTTPVD